MADSDPRAAPVPAGRLRRLARFGGMTGGLLGRAALAGAGQMARGQRPDLGATLLTPQTAARLTRDLGRMRGAAMKLGQMLSMDAGQILPPEMTAILAALRADAPPMPPRQLRDVLDRAWGPGWYQRFARFDLRPFASASIGQVHRAVTPEGRDLAIKVQYPGVRDSIESDLANMATLLRLPGLLPRSLDLTATLVEVRDQLQAEADYTTEAAHLRRFRDLLAGDDRFVLPDLVDDLSSRDVLAMSYVDSVPLEAVPEGARDGVARDLIGLCLRELFTFGWMQTDPNLANYRYQPDTDRIVLLDFGAVRAIPAALAVPYRALLAAALAGDRPRQADLLRRIRYIGPEMPPARAALIEEMFDLAMTPLRQTAPFDFAASDLVPRLTSMGMALGSERDLTTVPPPATLFVHRKIGGLYLLAARLGARVALAPLVAPFAGDGKDAAVAP